jgi:flap endonuclease GEN
MVAMALLIGCDHDLQGVPGFGVETALRFVQLFDEDHILDKYVSYFDEFLLFVAE